MTESESSEGDQTKAENIELFASRYLETIRGESDEERMADLDERIADREERLDSLVNQHGEDHHLVEKASKAIEKLESERDELRKTAEEKEQHRTDLLEAVAEDPGFELDENWLADEIIQAVTHALYGEGDDSIIVRNREVNDQHDVSELDEFDIIEMEHIVVSLADDRLAGNETVEDYWERLSDSVGFPAVKVVARSGPMAPKDVADELNEDSTTTKDRLKNFFQWDEFIPIYRPEPGIYGISTTGKYLINNYSDISSDGTAADRTGERAETSSSDQSTDNGSEQITMENLTEEEGGESVSDSTEPGDESESEPMDVDDKAEEMFADVGEDEP